MAEITTCCGSGTCDSIVTIGYMREMAQCAVVSSATPFSGCCEAEESAYTPTCGEISGETYASLRRYVDSNPVEDTNGFIVELPTIDTNCCEISLDEKLVSVSSLTFENTTITSVTLSTSSPSQCDPSWSVYKTNHCIRHTYGCVDNEISEISASTVDSNSIFVDSGELTKTFGGISVNGGVRTKTGTSVVSFSDVTVTTSTTDKCDNVEEASTYISLSDYTIEAVLDCSNHIECEGGECYFTVDDPCDEITRTFSLSTGEEFVEDTDGNRTIIRIGRNSGNSSNTILMVELTISDGNSSVSTTMSCTLDRDLCKITPKYEGYVPCGIFPGKDDWSDLIKQGLVTVIES